MKIYLVKEGEDGWSEGIKEDSPVICESCCGSGDQWYQDEEEEAELGACEFCDGTGIEEAE